MQEDATWASVDVRERNGTLEVSPHKELFRDAQITKMERPTRGDGIFAMRMVGAPEPVDTIFVSDWQALRDAP
ncbi:MAG TPA: hypothetical protein VNM92_13535 [Thermoanaerobaculia bacterium]|nr:hypothetical protein [Thermoanaerobaculia bacterium]